MEPRFWTKNYDYSVPTTISYPKIPVQEFVNLAAAFQPKGSHAREADSIPLQTERKLRFTMSSGMPGRTRWS